MTDATHCFLLFAAKSGSDADQRLCQAEVLIEELLEPVGVAVQIGTAWAICDAPDDPGCCEYTAELVLGRDARGRAAPCQELEERLCDIGFKLCRAAAMPAELHMAPLAA